MKTLWGLTRESHLISTGSTDLVLAALSILSGILVARLLGPEGRGELTVAIIWPSVIAALGMLGVREALTYEGARCHDRPSVLVATALGLALVQSAVLAGVGWLLIPWLTRNQSPEVTRAGLMFLGVIPAHLVAQYALGLLQGSMEIPLFNALRLVVSVVYLVAVLILWAVDAATVGNVTLGLLIANVCTALAALAAVVVKFGVRWVVNLVLVRRILSYGLRNHVGSISSMLNQRADQILMALLIDPKQLGWYAVAVSVSSLIRIPSGAFATLAFPRVAGSGPAEQGRLTGLYSRLNMTAALGIGLGLMLLIPVLIPWIYGAAYMGSIVPAEILSLATISLAVGQAWAGSLRGLGRPWEPAKAELLSLIVTVVGLAFLLVPLGILGAALTSLVAYLVAAVYLYQQVHQILALGVGDLLRPVSLSTIRKRLAL